jgi:ubiquinone/menaquinone biosynthesis C-methylase UbiE
MKANMSETQAWNVYWQTGAQESCVTQSDKEVESALVGFWTQLLAELSPSASVVDLATGNGAVVHLLLKQSPGLNLVGIDQASINTDNADVISAKRPKSPQFLSNVSILDMPFDAGSFSLATSQFGIEYAIKLNDERAGTAALDEVSRVLKKGGFAQFLMHHCDSALVQSNTRKQQELTQLLADGGLAEKLLAFGAMTISASELEKAGKLYLDTATIKTQALSGQVFGAIDYFLQQGRAKAQAGGSTQEQSQLIEATVSRMRAEHSRLSQLIMAAMTEKVVKRLAQCAENSGLEVMSVKEFYVGGEADGEVDGEPERSPDLLGWQFIAKKVSS